MFLTRASTTAGSTFSSNSTYRLNELFPQLCNDRFTHGSTFIYVVKGMRHSKLNVELEGTSSITPVTVRSTVSSTRTTFPMGSSSPNNDFAADTVSTIVDGSLSCWSAEPYTSGKENIFRKSSPA